MSARFDADEDAIGFVMQCIAETPDLYVRPRDAVSMTTTLADELGIDSIGLVALFYAVTDALGVEADEAEAERLRTIGDVVALLRELEGQRAA